VNPAVSQTFFAQVTASVSHELKNVLATISESSGLMGDLLDLARDGDSLDREELASSCTTIVEEVRRGFHIVRNLNSFAHLGDQEFADIDLEQVASLAAGMAAYLRRSRPISVASPTPEESRVRTKPVLLFELLHRLYAAAYEVLDPDGALRVEVRSPEDGSCLDLLGVESTRWLAAAGQDASRRIADLGATITSLEGRPGLTIRLPADLEARTPGPDQDSLPTS
jgi:signal transduction histidine kinase